MTHYALSVKQPWAALLVQGLKTIEVRRWPTARRGPVLIHAARVPDERPEAWAKVPPELLEQTRLRGGIIGSGDLIGCIAYRDPDSFAADEARHLNDPAWFKGPVLYGFTFTHLSELPFRPYSGWMRFFPVEVEASEQSAIGNRQSAITSGLLVSVRNPAEAEAALAGGADLIDVKEPKNGSLGRADEATIAAVVRAGGGRRPVSAALGELLKEGNEPLRIAGLSYVKWGLAGCARCSDWRDRLVKVAQPLVTMGCHPVAAAYADWQHAGAPSPDEVCAFACERSWGVVLLDTWQKNGKTLLDWLSVDEVTRLCRRCQVAGVRIALAGALGPAQIETLRGAAPDWFAVRTAACKGGKRTAAIDPAAVQKLVRMLHGNTRIALSGEKG